jgi:hypothetical protein
MSDDAIVRENNLGRFVINPSLFYCTVFMSNMHLIRVTAFLGC